MTQLTISQWLSSQATSNTGTTMTQSSQYPFAIIVASKRFYGYYDVLTVEGKRIPCSNMATARATCLELNQKNQDWC